MESAQSPLPQSLLTAWGTPWVLSVTDYPSPWGPGGWAVTSSQEQQHLVSSESKSGFNSVGWGGAAMRGSEKKEWHPSPDAPGQKCPSSAGGGAGAPGTAGVYDSRVLGSWHAAKAMENGMRGGGGWWRGCMGLGPRSLSSPMLESVLLRPVCLWNGIQARSVGIALTTRASSAN